LVAISLPAAVTNAVIQGANAKSLLTSAPTNPQSLTSSPARAADVSVTAADPNDPVEREFRKLMADDDAVQAEVDKWIQDDQAFAAAGGAPSATLKQRIQERFESICKGYEDFIKRHPRHAGVRVAYASLLGDMHEEDRAQEQLELALPMDTNNPAIYNNLANIYGHHGPVKTAFEYYAKAIQLNPREPVYYQNFATTVYLFRPDAKEYYGITEDQVFAKAFELYSNAMRLAPDDFPLATDVAETYYGIRPMRTEPALKAWTNALNIAHDEIEREGVYIHFARIKLMAKRFDEARAHLSAVTNDMYTDLKRRVLRNLNEQEAQAKGTNAPAATNTLKEPDPIPATIKPGSTNPLPSRAEQ
jgi:tetratricopeptide (TPR) repeat protein